MISPSSKLALKWAWLALVVLCVASYGLTRREVIASSLALVSGTLLLLSASFIVGAKLCLANAMRGAAQRAGIALGYGDAFRIYNLTQLAKYIPGAIWQFVGRFAVLRDKGISTAAIRDSLLAEQGWIAGSALICGLVLVLPYYFSGGSIDFAAGLDLSSQSVLGLATVVLVVVLVLVIKAPPRLWHWAWTLTPDARGLLVSAFDLDFLRARLLRHAPSVRLSNLSLASRLWRLRPRLPVRAARTLRSRRSGRQGHVSRLGDRPVRLAGVGHRRRGPQSCPLFCLRALACGLGHRLLQILEPARDHAGRERDDSRTQSRAPISDACAAVDTRRVLANGGCGPARRHRWPRAVKPILPT